jgi:hypothetical protein
MTFFGDIAYNIKAFFKNTFGDLQTEIQDLVKFLDSQLSSFLFKFEPVLPDNVKSILQTRQNELAPPETKAPKWNYITPRFPMPAAAAVPDLAGAYGDAIRAMLGPQGLPPGMIYGGAQGTAGAMGGDSIGGILGKIADNTKTTADALTLRRETLGGGKLGQLGVTAGELAVGGGGGIRMGDFFGGGNSGLIPAGTELERSVRRIMRDEARKNGTPGIMKRF